MDITLRNLDPAAYRDLESRAAREGRDVDVLIRDAIDAFLAIAPASQERMSLRDWVPEAYPPGNERLSADVDRLAYGVRTVVGPS